MELATTSEGQDHVIVYEVVNDQVPKIFRHREAGVTESLVQGLENLCKEGQDQGNLMTTDHWREGK